MANVLIEESTMTAIGDAIRDKTGKQDLIVPADMPQEIEGIQSGGDEWRDILYSIVDRSIREIDLSKSNITTVGRSVFAYCDKLELISLPEGIKSIENNAFDSTGIHLTELPNSVEYIQNGAFAWCKNLNTFFLPYKLNRIDAYAFSNCLSLSTITFLGKPTTIHAEVFINCNHLTTINVPWSEGEVANAPWGATEATINYNYTRQEV